MSSPLAIGAVSAVLRNLLDNGLIQSPLVGSPVKVTAVAPDTIDLQDEALRRLNLFLYQVTPNSGWRNHGLPSRSSAGGDRLTNPPLALDLHYVLTAYSRVDCEAEILLGYAMHLLHERPVLDRPAIRRALDPSPLDVTMLPAPFKDLAASDLADQVEQIKITPAAFTNDEMSKLWSAIQTHYRPSAAYEVSVVLIEATQPAISPLPVLTRGKLIPGTQRDQGVAVSPDVLPPLPTLFEARPKDNQPAARLGEVVTIEGMRLAGSGHEVRLSHRLLASPVIVTPDSVGADGRTVTLTLPTDETQFPLVAGQLSATIHFTPADTVVERNTNAIPLVIAPAPVIANDPDGLPDAAAVRPGGPGTEVEVTLVSRPRVHPKQRAILMLDGVEAAAAPRAVPTDPLIFTFPASLPNGTYWVRLRVDGTDSLLVNRKDPVPVFDTSQRITVT